MAPDALHGTFMILLILIDALEIEETAAGQYSDMSNDRLLIKRKRLQDCPKSKTTSDGPQAYLHEDNQSNNKQETVTLLTQDSPE